MLSFYSRKILTDDLKKELRSNFKLKSMKTFFFTALVAMGLLMSSFTTLNTESSISVFEDQLIPSCTATVTYNGEVVASFTETGPNACTNAYAKACDYIINQGGTCPQQ